jgi:hypothetical protein
MLRQVILELDDAALTALAKGDHRAAIDARKRKTDAIQVLMQQEPAEAQAAAAKGSLECHLSKIDYATLDNIVNGLKKSYDRCPYCASYTIPKIINSLPDKPPENRLN